MTAVQETPSPHEVPRYSGRDLDEYRHLAPLLAEFGALEEDDPRRAVLRDRLVAGFLPVVRHIAVRYRGRGEPVDDLEQVGTIGLLGSLDRFDPDRGADFLSFAVPSIMGEMRRHFRDRTWSMRVPRRLKELQGPVRDAVAALAEELQRAPRPSEIAARLGIDVEEVIEALRAQEAYRATSLDGLTSSGDSALLGSLGRADAELEKLEYRHTLRLLLDELPPRERKILVLRFFGDLTQTQIAVQMGLSQMHVSRLLSQTLTKLRQRMEAE